MNLPNENSTHHDPDIPPTIKDIRVRPNHGNVTSSRSLSRTKRRENSATKIDGRSSGMSSSSSSTKNKESDTVDSLSPSVSPTTGQNRASKNHKFDFHVHRKIGLNQNQNFVQDKKSQEKLSLAQSILASKQNLLAQVSLTPEENNLRQSTTTPEPEPVSPMAEESFLFESSNSSKIQNGEYNKMSQDNEDALKKMTLCDIEDEDYDFGSTGDHPDDETDATNNFPTQTSPYSGNNNLFQKSTHAKQQQVPGLLHIHKPLGINGENGTRVKTMDLKTWRDLKMTVLGTGGLQDGWIGQGFSFDLNVPYGLVQNKGGPCGVLAVVQALVLRNLMFGSQFCDEEDDDLPVSEPITNTDILTLRVISFRRVKAVVCALTEIIWRCAHIGQKSCYNKEQGSSSAWTDFSTAASNNEPVDTSSSGSSGSATICFSNASVGSELRIFDHEKDLKTFIHANLQRFDCVTLVYSAVLSRGIDNVQEDFDFPNSPLLGNHGYCSQELVNLLIMGKAISNVFDNQVALDEKILKGIESRSDIGFLSLFEHYDSCQVGNNLKTPKYPLWIVCSESHFSVLFSLNLTVANDATIDKFDLYYYDGLARQQQQIKLTIELNQVTRSRALHNHVGTTPSSSFYKNNNNNEREEDNEDLVPPLEKCIRTKWKNASVDWNDSEPIL